jgi:DNA-binding NtrC family response regulator
MRYPWPGNVRELRNTLERAVLMARKEEIRVEELGLPQVPAPHRGSGMTTGFELCLPAGGIDFRDVEGWVIVQALERMGWVQKDAARFLRMSRRKLNYRIQRLGITHPGWRRNRSGRAPEEDPNLC